MKLYLCIMILQSTHINITIVNGQYQASVHSPLTLNWSIFIAQNQYEADGKGLEKLNKWREVNKIEHEKEGGNQSYHSHVWDISRSNIQIILDLITEAMLK